MQLFSLGFVVEFDDAPDGEERTGGQEVAVFVSISISLSLVLAIHLTPLSFIFFFLPHLLPVLAHSLYSLP